MESDTAADISSEHYPIWGRLMINLKALRGKPRRVNKCAKYTREEKEAYNKEVQTASISIGTAQGKLIAIKDAATKLIPKQNLKPDQEPMSQATIELMEKRREARRTDQYSEVKELTRTTNKSKGTTDELESWRAYQRTWIRVINGWD